MGVLASDVERACHTLWSTSDAALRREADRWLTEWQQSQASWEAALALAQATPPPPLPPHHPTRAGTASELRLFGAAVLYNKCRRGGAAALSPAAAAGLRAELLRLAAAAGCDVRLRAKLCRAVATLASAPSGRPATEHDTPALLHEALVAGLPAASALELVGLVAEEAAEGEVREAEVQAVQALLLRCLAHAFEPSRPPPAAVPANAAPALASPAARSAALGALSAWASVPAAEAVTVAILAETPVFVPLLRLLASSGGASPGGSSGGAAHSSEALAAAELLEAAVEAEPRDGCGGYMYLSAGRDDGVSALAGVWHIGRALLSRLVASEDGVLLVRGVGPTTQLRALLAPALCAAAELDSATVPAQALVALRGAADAVAGGDHRARSSWRAAEVALWAAAVTAHLVPPPMPPIVGAERSAEPTSAEAAVAELLEAALGAPFEALLAPGAVRPVVAALAHATRHASDFAVEAAAEALHAVAIGAAATIAADGHALEGILAAAQRPAMCDGAAAGASGMTPEGAADRWTLVETCAVLAAALRPLGPHQLAGQFSELGGIGEAFLQQLWPLWGRAFRLAWRSALSTVDAEGDGEPDPAVDATCSLATACVWSAERGSFRPLVEATTAAVVEAMRAAAAAEIDARTSCAVLLPCTSLVASTLAAAASDDPAAAVVFAGVIDEAVATSHRLLCEVERAPLCEAVMSLAARAVHLQPLAVPHARSLGELLAVACHLLSSAEPGEATAVASVALVLSMARGCSGADEAAAARTLSALLCGDAARLMHALLLAAARGAPRHALPRIGEAFALCLELPGWAQADAIATWAASTNAAHALPARDALVAVLCTNGAPSMARRGLVVEAVVDYGHACRRDLFPYGQY
ncbi:hypothetical protein EMIHUDRAFT_224666 [Emiliania huxleyi CCMP1516]|uniref:Uncharacterized protein n=2 Tax=Emiliania huxleyi TaxID=2903 RepID=A0A0D3KRB0_EMIH1|nr:hypothetical protein EMIHUDRAFT_224666 [Emiliania huxleyi CCMP1516]EOD38295.1 hypothetical protein EMIHUDRAFT_224666 [Emiliania huxleyi CCMP1516]|eukprot:XP_005790724.1 hypothetical protein EMIHUDRAFT_224666 [Emiliania huxleyi CCMP1516]